MEVKKMNELICKTCCRCKGDVKICKLKADCIVCEREILEHCQDLKKINCNGSNCYYHVDGTNTVIVHIEEGLCILCDNSIAGCSKTLPEQLSAIHFTMQKVSKIERCVAVARGITFYETIQRLVHGNDVVDIAKNSGLSLDHKCETYDNRISHTSYCENKGRKSHKVRVYIQCKMELEAFLKDIRNAETKNEGIYFDSDEQKVVRKRHFVSMV